MTTRVSVAQTFVDDPPEVFLHEALLGKKMTYTEALCSSAKLTLCTRGQHDDRDVSQGRISSELRHHVQAAEKRHLDIGSG